MTAIVGTDLAFAAELLAAGQLVAFPTETVYGLGADARSASAVAKVFAAKNRPRFDPLIVHAASQQAARQLVTEWPPPASALADRFWPGPLTLVLPKIGAIPDLVTSGLPTVAIRVPSHPVARELIERAGVPVAAPSANPFGAVSPTTAAHVSEQLGNRVAYIVDGGPCTVGVESTIVHIGTGSPMLLRHGGVPVEQIEELIGPLDTPSSTGSDRPQLAPGMLDRHYAPRTPLKIVAKIESIRTPEECGLLTYEPVVGQERFAEIEVLSTRGDLTEAAAAFYAAIRRLDAAGVRQIIALRFPEYGLGHALNDRLTRASTTS